MIFFHGYVIAVFLAVLLTNHSFFLPPRLSETRCKFNLQRTPLVQSSSCFRGTTAVKESDRVNFDTNFNELQSALKIAVLIDGDNAESILVGEYVAEAGRFGKVTVKRIYADWTSPHMKSWKDSLNSYAVRPMQKFAYTQGKSSTDTALIIDAMVMHRPL